MFKIQNCKVNSGRFLSMSQFSNDISSWPLTNLRLINRLTFRYLMHYFSICVSKLFLKFGKIILRLVRHLLVTLRSRNWVHTNHHFDHKTYKQAERTDRGMRESWLNLTPITSFRGLVAFQTVSYRRRFASINRQRPWEYTPYTNYFNVRESSRRLYI